MRYEHTQRGPIYLIVGMAASAMLVSALWIPETWVQCLLFATGGMMGILSGGFRELTVRDEGSHLIVQFGPIPLFKRRVAYDEIESVAQDRSTILEGWGIHMSPRGGWIWNLWGFDCVELQLSKNRRLRIGTDQPEALAAFLGSVSSGPAVQP